MILDEKTLGQRIRKAREKSGMSQTELAKTLGIGQRGISELENGNRKLSVFELITISSAMDTPISFFLEGELHQEDLDADLLSHFHKLQSDDLKKNVIEMVRLLSDSSV